MAVTGAAPKAAKLGHSPTLDWTEVVDEPYEPGRTRELPKLGRRKWNDLVVAWWAQVRIMPHCSLWTETDWIFAQETGMMKHEYLADDRRKTTEATEIRRREDMMGVTLEARRKLRIRYVSRDEKSQQRQVVAPAGAGPAGGTNVVPIGDRRARMTG